MNPGISIIIPTYNRELFVTEAIQSVLDQEYNGNLEIIISDDGSTDKTLEMAETFGKKVKIIRKPANCKTQGVASTRNRGIKASTQPFVCFLDSDDFYLPGHLNKMVAVFEKDSGLGFAFCRLLQVKEESGRRLFKQWTHQYIFKSDIVNPVVSRSKVVHTNSFMFRRKVFDTVGYFDESYSIGEDSDLWMRISEQFSGVFSDHFGCAYRIDHGLNQLTKIPPEQKRNCHAEIYGNALKRYYMLRLNNPSRIFELKHLMLHYRYRQFTNNRLVYYLKYLNLISRYPITYFRKIPIGYYEFKENKKNRDWCDLQVVLNQVKNNS
jgi:glycosyltransferase involved in cell wall biosynthesis